MTARRLASRRLGSNGTQVSAIRLGCMGMSDAYGTADEAASIATIHAALDAAAGARYPAAQMAMLDGETYMVRA